MADQDIFEDTKGENNADADPTKAAAAAGSDDSKPTDQLLKSIVNEDGTPKYASTEEALKATAHAQDHIKNLETELAALREKGNASDKIDELMEAMKSKGSGQGEESTSTMKPEDVLEIVQSHLKDSKAAETRQDNINSVANVFKSRYGKDASEKLYGKAEDLGFGKEEINRMIATNPKAALKVLGEGTPVKQASEVLGSPGVDTANFRGQPAAKPKSIMGPTKSGDLVDAWKASQQKTLERLGLKD